MKTHFLTHHNSKGTFKLYVSLGSLTEIDLMKHKPVTKFLTYHNSRGLNQSRSLIIIIIIMIMIIITTTTTTTTTTIIIIIALKGASRDFYNLLTAPRTVSNTYAQVAWAQSCSNHVQHIERSSRATCSVPIGTKGQLSY